jgi:hypothetical protein
MPVPRRAEHHRRRHAARLGDAETDIGHGGATRPRVTGSGPTARSRRRARSRVLIPHTPRRARR